MLFNPSGWCVTNGGGYATSLGEGTLLRKVPDNSILFGGKQVSEGNAAFILFTLALPSRGFNNLVTCKVCAHHGLSNFRQGSERDHEVGVPLCLPKNNTHGPLRMAY